MAMASPAIWLTSEFRSWSSSPSMHYRWSSGSKSPPFWPKTFSALPKIQQAAGTVFFASGFVNISYRGETKLQRFSSLLCLGRITTGSVGFVLRLKAAPWLVQGTTASARLLFEVSHKLPRWPLDAATKGFVIRLTTQGLSWNAL